MGGESPTLREHNLLAMLLVRIHVVQRSAILADIGLIVKTQPVSVRI